MYRGLGLCAFIELTTPGPAFYGVGGARISSQDGCTIKLEPSGKLTCMTGVTEQGQGTDAMIRSEERRVGEEGRSRWAPDH